MTGNHGISLGAIARLVISDRTKLKDPILHRVPSRMLEERMKAERALENRHEAVP